jgi:hypothetical protein
VPEPEVFGLYIGVVPQRLEQGLGDEEKYLFEQGSGVLAGNAGAVIGLLGGRNDHQRVGESSQRRIRIGGKRGDARAGLRGRLGRLDHSRGRSRPGGHQKQVTGTDRRSGGVARNMHIQTKVHQPHREHPQDQPAATRSSDEHPRVPAEVPNVIAGERRPLGATADVVAPHEHALTLGRIPVARPDDVHEAIDAALAARHDWSRTPWWDRAAIFLRAAELANGQFHNELLATTMLGQSKTFHQAEIDVNELIDFFRYNVKLVAQIFETQPFSVTGVMNVMDHRPLEGFVPALTPFNFTAIAGNLPATPALMGNVVVWKPSEKSALSSQVVMRLFEEAGLPPGVINLVHGDGQLVSATAQAHELLAGISFTGSTAVFRSLWRGTAAHLDTYRSYPRLVGETGGKNAVIAHPSADPQALLVALVRGAFEYQGAEVLGGLTHLRTPQPVAPDRGTTARHDVRTAGRRRHRPPDFRRRCDRRGSGAPPAGRPSRIALSACSGSRCLSRRRTSSAGTTAATCTHSKTPPTTSSAPYRTGPGASTAKPSRWLRRGLLQLLAPRRGGPPNAMASTPARCSKRPAGVACSAGKKTCSSTSPSTSPLAANRSPNQTRCENVQMSRADQSWIHRAPRS